MPKDNRPTYSIYIRSSMKKEVSDKLEELGKKTGFTYKGRAHKSKLFVYMVTKFEETEDFIIVRFPKRGK